MAVQYAARLALIAFAVFNLQGALSRADISGTLQSALVVAALFFVVGTIIGELSRQVVEENVEKELHKKFFESGTAEENMASNTSA